MTTTSPRLRRLGGLGRLGRLGRLGTAGLACAAVAAGLLTAAPAAPAAATVRQPQLESRSADILRVDGKKFRDLDGNGRLTPYEDWRLSPERRAKDLVGRLDLEEKAGQLIHGSLAGTGTYDRAAFEALLDQHVTTYISRLGVDARTLATEHDDLQAAAEAQPFGIPLMISTDPRSGFTVTAGQTVASGDFSAFPDAIGVGAVDSPLLTRAMGDVIRREYRAVGITEALSPQADIATEPRWSRINGTFGSTGELARRHVGAYVAGLQGGDDGVGRDGVVTVVKHWAGYGAQVDGYDSHYYYGRFAAFPGNNFAEHLVPYEAAFAKDAGGIMPTYSILKDLKIDGKTVEQVGAGHSEDMLGLLRDGYGFDGVITSDWGITGDCPQACEDNRPPSFFVGPWGAGMSWGVEDLTRAERFASTINAGVDIVGGDDHPEYIVQAVRQGILAESRVDEAATRVLAQKFSLGLFEDPYVDPSAADRVVGNRLHQALGETMQARSLTLLKNDDRTLPLEVANQRGRSGHGVRTVYLYGVQPAAAQKLGLRVVADPADADVAVVRLSDPKAGADLTGLDFTGTEGDYQALVAADEAGATTIASPQLSRPLILGKVLKHSDAVLANYGVSDDVLLRTVVGRAQPSGSLPFELPSSMAEVAAQLGDVPDDTAHPLFERGFGLSYRGGHR
ncbi:glycoside hydrolase family 3 protein [Cellulomonas sp. PhB143]|uniref:glycoside hydrolase family 3 protein n=1 Tax=Cellulomonas sp. PhB143 TaxID=2485186 RepID=UPI000F48E9DA|nr:glycoside hydrolase family 3 N-terminal domain-containing protein [Cellulomonas sp. PhB143]ROS75320.1 beta-glucosidase [Cellulomonas sp. PhB143]